MKVLWILTIISSVASAFKDNHIHGKIIDGVLINITDVPWATSMYTAENDDGEWEIRFTCGGSIIGSNEIVTAAHCIATDLPSSSKIFFRAGSANRELGSLHNLDYVRYHPLQKPEDPGYDVAFVRVKEPFKFSKKLTPIRVRNSEPESGSVVMLVGWGKTIPDDPFQESPKKLRAVNLTMWDNDDCSSKFNISFELLNHPEVHKCMKNIGEGSSKAGCYGDSGGGVVYRNKLVGVVTNLLVPRSFLENETVSCNAQNVIMLYNSAIKIKSWIEEMINESERLGSR